MAIIYQDNFDGEVATTSPPANWKQQSAGIITVSDASYVTSPHSAYIAGSAKTCWHNEGANWGSNRLTIKIKLVSTQQVYLSVRQDTSETTTPPAIIGPFIRFYNYDIHYYNGSYIDTGYNYTTGNWFTYHIETDVAADRFDMWMDTTKIIDDGIFYAGGTITGCQSMVITTSGNTLYIDDIQIGAEDPAGQPRAMRGQQVAGMNTIQGGMM